MAITERNIDAVIEEEKELRDIAKNRYEELGVQNCKKRYEEHVQMISWLEELKAFKEIGTVEEFKNLKEKAK